MFKKFVVIQFIKFGIIGFLNTITGYVIYSVLVYFGFHYFIGSIIAFVVGVSNGFYWNNKYVFRKQDEYRNTIMAVIKYFISYGLTGLILQNALLYAFIDILRFSEYIAPIFCLFLTVPSNFLLSKFWTFRNIIRERKEIYHEEN
jgi:putative flippase GtrA